MFNQIFKHKKCDEQMVPASPRKIDMLKRIFFKKWHFLPTNWTRSSKSRQWQNRARIIHKLPSCSTLATWWLLPWHEKKETQTSATFVPRFVRNHVKKREKKEQISFGQVCSIKKIFQKMQNFGYYSNTLEEWRQASRIRTMTTTNDGSRFKFLC